MIRKWFPLLLIVLIGFLPVISSAETEPIHMTVGEAKILSLEGFKTIAISNPEVIEIAITSSQDILINARKAGLSVVNIWTKKERFSYKIVVQEDYSAMEAEIAGLINNPVVSVRVNQKSVILSGTLTDSWEADQAVRYGKMYRENVINNLNIQSNYQILLSILVTELKRDSEKKYGFSTGSWWSTQDGIVFHDWEFGFTYDKTKASLLTGTSIGSLLNLMQSNGDAKILAVPSIVTVSGKEANFLAGGEIPIPMSDGKGGTVVVWKEYGIRLKVTANFEKNNIIAMAVSPEVSTVDWSNAIIVDGFKLPALSTRKATTNVEFSEGKTLVIGGLLSREDSANVYKIPLLGDIPILGALFRSKSFQRGQTELLFFVTPRIIKDDLTLNPKTITNPANQGPYYEEDQKKQPRR